MKVVLGLVFALLIVCRIVATGSHPAAHPDEGFWANGARNFARFGDPLLDGRLHPFLSPGTFVELSAWFTLFPASLTTARLASAALGILTCVLVYLLARRAYPERAWLVLVLFGFSSITLLTHRVALLESRQMFWLTLAAYLWLSAIRGSAWTAGIAYGVALLVKSNSLYLLPAFLLTPVRRSAGGVFVGSGLLVAAGGYLTAWAIDPPSFVAAFRYELDGQHWLDGHDLFHVGRFGLHPARLAETLGDLLATDPVLPLLALLGLMTVLRHRHEASRADVFFSAWLVGGLAFTLGQIYCPYRYLTTLAPAFAFLVARPLNTLLTTRGARLVVAGLIILALVGPVRVGWGVSRQTNADYWRAVVWIGTHVPRDEPVLASPTLGLSLQQRSLDYYRLINGYDGSVRPLAVVVGQHRIGWIVVDGEWREYQTPDMAAFLAARCVREASPGGFEVWRVVPVL